MYSLCVCLSAGWLPIWPTTIKHCITELGWVGSLGGGSPKINAVAADDTLLCQPRGTASTLKEASRCDDPFVYICTNVSAFCKARCQHSMAILQRLVLCECLLIWNGVRVMGEICLSYFLPFASHPMSTFVFSFALFSGRRHYACCLCLLWKTS